MIKQRKSIVIFVFLLIAITPCCLAQNQEIDEDQLAIKSVHVFNLKPKYSADDLQIILDKFNSLFAKLGHPECRYVLWESSDSKYQTQFLWESTWSNRSVYDEIHQHKEYRKLVREDLIGLRMMFKDHEVYKYREIPF